MFCELWLSQRYLKAGKREKIISITAFISMIGIAIGVLVLIVVIAVMSGFDRYLEDKIVGTNAHLLIEFYAGQGEPARILEKLKAAPHVVAAAPYVAGQAFLKSGQQVFSFEMRGIDPKLQLKVGKLGEYLRQGSLDLEGNDVVLGRELALRLGLRLGDKISLISPATLTQTDFKIKGIFSSGMYLYDSGLILTSIKAARDFFKTSSSVSGIAVRADNLYKVDAIKDGLYARISGVGPYEIRTWVDANRNFLYALKLEKAVMFIVVTMTTVVAAFGIIGTLIMSVMSRTRDIGILRSVGAKAKTILAIFLFQGLQIGVTGIVLGLIGGVSLALSLNRVVDFISGVIGRSLIPKDIYYFDRIPTYISTGDISMIVISALAISLLASAYPAYYAVRLNPSEAVRHE